MSESQDRQTHAIIIGVDFYSRLRGFRDNSLSGCVNDARQFRKHIEASLKHRGIPESDYSKYITFFSSTRKASYETEEPLEDPKDRPTYENICNAILELTDKAKAGDTVLISYSGHGARVDTVVRDWPAKGSGKDEVICPFDISTKGKVIRDFELNYLFSRMVDKGIRLTVFLDCCNSGSATRAPEQKKDRDMPKYRGLLEGDIRARPGAEEYKKEYTMGDKIAEMRIAWDTLQQKSTQSTAGTGAMLKPMGYAIYSGCLAHELSMEFSGSGALTSATTTVLAMTEKIPHPEQATLQQLYRYIFDAVYRLYYDKVWGWFYQSPLLLGDVERPFPGSVVDVLAPNQQKSATALIPIRSVPDLSAAKTAVPVVLFLRAGAAHGVQIGDEYEVYLWYEEPWKAATEVRVVVTEVRTTISVVVPINPQLPETWASQYKVECEARGTPNQGYPWPRGCVACLRTRAANQAKSLRLLGSVPGLSEGKYIPGEIPLVLIGEKAEEAEDFRLAYGSDGYELQGRDANALTPATLSLSTCLKNARNIARYNLLRAITSPSYAHAFDLTATQDGEVVKVKFSPVAKYKGVTETRYINIVVFHFTQNYGVRKVYPFDGNFESVDTGDTREFSFKGKGGYLKALMFFASTSFDAWEQEGADVGSDAGSGGSVVVEDLPIAQANPAVERPSAEVQDVEEENEQFNYWGTKDLTLE
ncbi:caspase domain-containing protein [Tirmania nivea]|nr:caspase domain-containing protein [Tirmania nivea]